MTINELPVHDKRGLSLLTRNIKMINKTISFEAIRNNWFTFGSYVF